jgi:hypothetical protein
MLEKFNLGFENDVEALCLLILSSQPCFVFVKSDTCEQLTCYLFSELEQSIVV